MRTICKLNPHPPNDLLSGEYPEPDELLRVDPVSGMRLYSAQMKANGKTNNKATAPPSAIHEGPTANAAAGSLQEPNTRRRPRADSLSWLDTGEPGASASPSAITCAGASTSNIPALKKRKTHVSGLPSAIDAEPDRLPRISPSAQIPVSSDSTRVLTSQSSPNAQDSNSNSCTASLSLTDYDSFRDPTTSGASHEHGVDIEIEDSAPTADPDSDDNDHKGSSYEDNSGEDCSDEEEEDDAEGDNAMDVDEEQDIRTGVGVNQELVRLRSENRPLPEDDEATSRAFLASHSIVVNIEWQWAICVQCGIPVEWGLVHSHVKTHHHSKTSRVRRLAGSFKQLESKGEFVKHLMVLGADTPKPFPDDPIVPVEGMKETTAAKCTFPGCGRIARNAESIRKHVAGAHKCQLPKQRNKAKPTFVEVRAHPLKGFRKTRQYLEIIPQKKPEQGSVALQALMAKAKEIHLGQPSGAT